MSHNSSPNRTLLPMVQQGDVVPRPPEELQELLAWIGVGVDWVESIEDEEVRDQVFSLLDGIDSLHRQLLERFVDQVEALGGPGLMRRISMDRQVQTLLSLYDLDERYL